MIYLVLGSWKVSYILENQDLYRELNNLIGEKCWWSTLKFGLKDESLFLWGFVNYLLINSQKVELIYLMLQYIFGSRRCNFNASNISEILYLFEDDELLKYILEMHVKWLSYWPFGEFRREKSYILQLKDEDIRNRLEVLLESGLRLEITDIKDIEDIDESSWAIIENNTDYIKVLLDYEEESKDSNEMPRAARLRKWIHLKVNDQSIQYLVMLLKSPHIEEIINLRKGGIDLSKYSIMTLSNLSYWLYEKVVKSDDFESVIQDLENFPWINMDEIAQIIFDNVSAWNLEEYLMKVESKINMKVLLEKNLLKIIPNWEHNDYLVNQIYNYLVSWGLNDWNWEEALLIYSLDLEESRRMTNETKNWISTIFYSQQNQAYIYEKIRGLYISFLQWKEITQKEKIVLKVLKKNWVWNLSLVEWLVDLVNSLNWAIYNKFTPQKTRESINKWLLEVDEKQSIKNNRWSNNEKNRFYNISEELLLVAPSLYDSFLSLFKILEKDDFKTFSEGLLWDFHIWISLLSEADKDWDLYYDPKKLVLVRNRVKNIISRLEWWEETGIVFREEDIFIKKETKELFNTRFWIIKYPDELSPDNIESIRNHSLYFANLNDKDWEKELLIWLMLWLKLNWKWNDFRSWKEIDFEEIFEKEYANRFSKLYWEANQRQEVLFLNIENNHLLQQDIVTKYEWSSETLDIILLNLGSNFEDLLDPDNYTSGYGKVIFETTMVIWLDKIWKIWKALAMKFQEIKNWKEIDEESSEIIKILVAKLNIWWDIDIQTITELQKSFSTFSPIINMVNDFNSFEVRKRIKELQEYIAPNDELIEIFNKLWEDFSTDSWIYISLSDIQYIESIVQKWQDKLSEAELEIVNWYISDIKNDIYKLQENYESIRDIFMEKLWKLLRKKDWEYEIEDFNKLWPIWSRLKWVYNLFSQNKQEEWHSVVTVSTNDMDTVIKNIRACLWCQKKECNNDTNLTFLDWNKFFIASYSQNNSKQSISDQLVSLYKTNYWDTFVFDTLYWHRTPDILIAHIMNIYKKLRVSGNLWVSLFIPKKVYEWCNLTYERLTKFFGEEEISVEHKKWEAEVNIDSSSYWDIYHEWEEVGGYAPRKTWVIKSNWIVLNFK